MSHSRKSIQLDKTRDKIPEGGWRAALSEAKRQHLQAQMRVRALRKSIKLISAKIASGEPWPGPQSDDHDSEKQHSV